MTVQQKVGQSDAPTVPPSGMSFDALAAISKAFTPGSSSRPPGACNIDRSDSGGLSIAANMARGPPVTSPQSPVEFRVEGSEVNRI
jgi:hypothetical protein